MYVRVYKWILLRSNTNKNQHWNLRKVMTTRLILKINWTKLRSQVTLMDVFFFNGERRWLIEVTATLPSIERGGKLNVGTGYCDVGMFIFETAPWGNPLTLWKFMRHLVDIVVLYKDIYMFENVDRRNFMYQYYCALQSRTAFEFNMCFLCEVLVCKHIV